jgi:GntR family transcriptional regulator
VEKKIVKPMDFRVDAKSAVPVYEQIKQSIKLLIISAYIEEGDQLLSIRELGARLKIHPNTIAKVYYQLEVEGFIYSRHGAGYYVKIDGQKVKKEKEEMLAKIAREYIIKASKLGYSAKEMFSVLETALAEIIPDYKKKGGGS